MKPALHINNYSDEEIKSTWFNQEELQRIREKADRTIGLMEQDRYINSRKDCTRGLECRTRYGARQRRQNTKNARTTVLHEQDIQRYDGNIDIERLAFVYAYVSSQSYIAARMAGESDEKYARELDARVERKKRCSMKPKSSTVSSRFSIKSRQRRGMKWLPSLVLH